MTTITSTGLTRTRLDERLAALQTAVQAIFGDTINLDPDTIDGQTLGIFAESISNLDQLAEDIYQGFNPQSATGLALSRLVQLNGIKRIEGAYSTVILTATGTEGTEIPAGSLVSSPTTSVVFETLEDATIPASGTVNIAAQTQTMGAIAAPAGTLTKIDSPVFGWQTVTNTNDATLGRAEETDESLRLRRAKSTSTPAQAVLDSVYGALANIAAVSQVRVFENDQDTVQPVTSLPPHSIYCVVDGGAAADIAAAIWLRKSAGATMYGAITQQITDNQGNPHDIKFSRPTDVNIYIVINLVTRTGWPSDGATRIKNALVAWALTEQEIGEELIHSRLFSPVNTVPGFSITSLFIGTSPAPSGTANIAVAFDAIARLDTSRITVNVTT